MHLVLGLVKDFSPISLECILLILRIIKQGLDPLLLIRSLIGQQLLLLTLSSLPNPLFLPLSRRSSGIRLSEPIRL